ncbi:MAG: acyl-CoA thioesterase II [Hyphomicrobiaceae bacterium]|nr:acyl-CoA thioesterase II [Hyphomicrobiaceae bacterium]
MSALASVLSILDLEQLEQNLFRGRSPADGWQRVYGGQVLGQALMAGARTVDPSRIAHSLHAYFLLGGDPKHPIIYEVEPTRDGGSFSTRRVKAIQHGRIMFVMGISFQEAEAGLDHATAMPDVPPPEDLASATELFAKLIDKLPKAMRAYWSQERPIDMRPVDLSRYMSREPREPRQQIWMKPNGTLPDDPLVHQGLLAYASDFTLLDTALIGHGKLLFDADMQLASLDHALWFHRPFRFDDWVLYSQDSPNASGARGFCRGSIYSRDGHLIASTVQEGLMRQRSA